jgi:hypothetical protein
MRRAAGPLALLAAIVLAAGCGSSGDGTGSGPQAVPPPLSGAVDECAAPAGTEDLRVLGTDCSAAATVAGDWSDSADCRPAAAGSRGSCRLGAWRCLSVKAARGIEVSCAGRGRSIAFSVRP